MKLNDIVKYSKPADGEADFRFVLLDNPDEVAAHAKAHNMAAMVQIQLVCDWAIKPIETVELSEICAS